MRLHEYQAKRILSRYGVPIPNGQVAASVAEACQIAEQLDGRIVLKAQVLTGRRGRAGAIRLAQDGKEAARLAGQMFGMDVHGYVASRILVEEAIDIEQEIYLGVALDRMAGQPVLVASARGGLEISELTHDTPEHVYRAAIDPLLGLRAYQIRELAYDIELTRKQTASFVPIALGLWRAFVESEATLVEVNPLVIGTDGDFSSLNTRMDIDDQALFRRRELSEMRDESQETAAERLARRHGIHYVRLGGDVGCLSNGAGLAMATMDLLHLHGARAASFVDVGIGAQPSKVIVGLRLALASPVRAVLVSVFGGVTRCDEIAQGIVSAWDELSLDVPLVVRFEGTNKDKGHLMLERAAKERDARAYVADSLPKAVEQVVEVLHDSHRVQVG